MTPTALVRTGLLILLALAQSSADSAVRELRSMAAHPRLAPVQSWPGPLSAYQANLRRVFRDAFAPQVRLRALITPSFAPESMVGLRQAGVGHEIFALRPRRQIWLYQAIRHYRYGRASVMSLDGTDPARQSAKESAELARLEKDLPADPADMPLSRCAVTVDPALAAEVIAAWRTMLAAVETEEDLMPGLDGTTYVFSMETGGRSLAGETWTPNEGTAPARLARLAEAMHRYCEKRAPEALVEIKSLARGLAGNPG
jgi:hypothetical protein